MFKTLKSAILSAGLLSLSVSGAMSQSSVTMVPAREQVIEEYRAYIGRDDLYNSSGVRLTKPWEVLRQDRANFHRFGIRQNREDGDSFFASAENRAKMENMLASGFISQEAGDAILNGQVWINVQIIGSSSTGRHIKISVER